MPKIPDKRPQLPKGLKLPDPIEVEPRELTEEEQKFLRDYSKLNRKRKQLREKGIDPYDGMTEEDERVALFLHQQATALCMCRNMLNRKTRKETNRAPDSEEEEEEGQADSR